MLTKAQQDALKWLDEVIATPVDFNGERQHARTIREMLARPVLPEMTPHWEVLSAMMRDYNSAPTGDWTVRWEAAYHALRDALVKPATKTVEVWHVEWVDHGGKPRLDVETNESVARGQARRYEYANCRCVRVTGPHQQDVPA